MRRVLGFVMAWALVFAGVTTAGCSSSVVGEWQGDDEGAKVHLTLLSDGTGDAGKQGEPTVAIKWKRVNDKYEITADGITVEATLRENETLALFYPDQPQEGLLILTRKNGSR